MIGYMLLCHSIRCVWCHNRHGLLLHWKTGLLDWLLLLELSSLPCLIQSMNLSYIIIPEVKSRVRTRPTNQLPGYISEVLGLVQSFSLRLKLGIWKERP